MEVAPRGRLGHLAAWHLPGGPVGPPSKWAATSNVEVGQTTYLINRGRVVIEGKKGSEGQSQRRGGKERVEWGKGDHQP